MTDPKQNHAINQVIRNVSLYFSAALLLAAVAAAVYMQESPAEVLQAWVTIQTSPCPLVTDYFKLGSLSASFLNAGICGLCCALLTRLRHAEYRPNVWAGYFLVIAHCFYGLNLVNMTPLMLSFWVYCRVHRLRFRDNLDWAMFITSFAPFISELLFRYPVMVDWSIPILGGKLNLFAVLIAALLSLFIGFTLPAILPGASKLHRGYNLYNGGLATGLLGLLIFAFLYRTMGVEMPAAAPIVNAAYSARGESYLIFVNAFYLLAFGICLAVGRHLNGGSFRGYGDLLRDTGYKANFLQQYGPGPTLINLGFYGLMMLAYFDAVILLTDGAGFNGATCGIILAAMTFSASGQHPRNVWPILAGYALLSLTIMSICALTGRPIPWTLSTQGYMNGIAFATGLCPFAGVFGWQTGLMAGFLGAVMCTSTSVMHGGFVLYNGGLTAGITALILLPLLDTYKTRTEKWGRSD